MYYALYRKYRPKDFDLVVGQDHIIKTLRNSIINKNLSHAYMFFGPRGTGKTTVSKIFARNVNCLSPIDGIACGKCDACKISFSKECIDIIEIDAASNNGVDEIRELKNNVNLVPSYLKYNVYIIDEVHMLSTGAFNALLKTLEEPPEHIIFILATTDPQKVPDTIISRCQCFSFKKISNSEIKNKLSDICKSENIQIDENVLDKISLLSDGGLRDAIGSLDKLISYSNNNITLNDFNFINGTISDEDLHEFLLNISNKDINKILLMIDSFNQSGKNIVQIIVQIINYSRDLIVNYYLYNKDISISIILLQDFTNLLNEKIIDIKKSGNVRVYFEMLILKFIYDNSNIVDSSPNIINNLNNNDQKKAYIDNNDDKLINNDNLDDNNSINNHVDKKILNIDEIIKVRINNTMASAEKKLLDLELKKFKLLTDFSFDQKIGAYVNSLLDSKVRACGKNYLIISFNSDAVVNQNISSILTLEKVYNDITKSDMRLAIVSDKTWDEIKKEYIYNLKNNISYNIMEEPEVLFEESEKNDIISSSAISLFGEDIVEID